MLVTCCYHDVFKVKEAAGVLCVVLETALLFFGWFGASDVQLVTCHDTA
jgi:Flp pilus assembly protein protease CpaA